MKSKLKFHFYLLSFSADGIFIVRLLSKNTSSIFVSDLLTELYVIFKKTSAKDNLVRSTNNNNDSSLRPGVSTDDENDNEFEPPECNLDSIIGYPAQFTQIAGGNEVKSKWGPQNPPPLPPHVMNNAPGYNYRMTPPPPPPHSPGLNDFQLIEQGRRFRGGGELGSRDESMTSPNAPALSQVRECQ